MLVERETWAAEGPAARDLAFHFIFLSVECAEEFCGAFAFPVDICGIDRVGRASIAFRNMCHIGRLRSVDCTRTCEQELLGAVSGRKLESALCARNDRREHLKTGISRLSGASLGGRMYDVLVCALGKRKATDIAFMKCDRRIACNVRALLPECFRVAREDSGSSSQSE